VKLKVCGVSDAEFAIAAARLGVDYLGFIFESSSPRFVTVAKAAEISAALSAEPSRVRLVGVFVKQSVREIVAAMRAARLDIVQLHRRADPEDVAALRGEGFEVWTLAGGAPGDGVLFDSSHGDGETAFRRGPYLSILAGGISSANVGAAAALGPDVIDANGSLETSPGRKDVARLREFLEAFRIAAGQFAAF